MVEAVLKYDSSDFPNPNNLIEVSFFNITNPKLEELLNNIISARQDNVYVYIREAKKYTDLIDKNITTIYMNDRKIKEIKRNVFFIFSSHLRHQIKDYRQTNEKLINDNTSYEEKIKNLNTYLKYKINSLFYELGFENVYKESSNNSETSKFVALLEDDYIYALAQKYIDKNQTYNKDNEEKNKSLNKTVRQNKNHIKYPDFDKNSISKDNEDDKQL